MFGGTPKPVAKGLTTGGEIDGIVNALVAAANDSSEEVRTAMSTSLKDIGFRQPNLVLHSCNEFLIKNPKSSQSHRVLLLKVMFLVIEAKRDDIPEDFGLKLIDQAIKEMITEKDVVPDWQQAAASLLVTLGMRWPNPVMDELLKLFPSGVLPHYFVMKTLGDFVAANPVATVPRVRDIFNRVLPVLGSIKHDNMRWVFAASVGHFCEAAVIYVANIDQGVDKTITVTTYSADAFPVYEILSTPKWLQSGESRVRLACIQAIGAIFAILSREQFESQIAKLIPVLIGMYRKEKEHLPITQAFASVLEGGIRTGGFQGSLEPLLPNILLTLHGFVAAEYTNPGRPYNELLHTFEIIGRGFPDQLLTFLIGRMEQKDYKSRIAALNVTKHIVTRLDAQLEDKKGLLVSGIKPLVTGETVVAVKAALAQLVINLASNGYLLLEGGESLVEFIVRGSAIIVEEDDPKSPKPKPKAVDPDGVTEAQLQMRCDQFLTMMTTTASLEPALWPYLFETVVPPDFTGAVAVVAKGLTHIASAKRASEAEDYIIDFDRAVNLPKPAAIIARLLVLLNAPLRRGKVGKHILELLISIGPILHPSLPARWDVTLPKVLSHLEENSAPDKWDKENWENLVLRLLEDSIYVTNDDEWNVALGTAIADQTPFYNKDPELKKSSLKLLGKVMEKSGHKEFIRTKLDVMFASTDHTNALESEGCAMAFGFCGATHLDVVLEKLQAAAKQFFVKKGGGLFKFGGSDKGKGGLINGGKKVKNSILLAFGYVTMNAQPSLMASRVDVHVITPIKANLSTLKSPLKKLSAIKMMNLIGQAVHPSHLKLENPFVFKQRDDLIKIIQGYFTPQNPAQTNTQVKVQGLAACATLLLLEPPAAVELETSLLTTALNFFNLPVEGENDVGLKPLWDALNDVISSLLLSQPTVATLCRIIQLLEPYVRSGQNHLRERAVRALLHAVKTFFDCAKANQSAGKPNVDIKFAGLGPAVGLLVPRCTDPVVAIRKAAMETVQYLLVSDVLLRATPPPEALSLLKPFPNSITSTVPKEQFSVVHELAKVLSHPALLAADELPPLLHTTMLGLTDSQQASTSGSCVMLFGLIKLRGEELAPHVANLVTSLVTAMEGIAAKPALATALEGISSDQTMNGSLNALKTLATHHLLLVVDHLLTFPMPHSTHVVKSLQVIATEPKLVMPMVNHLTDIINNKVPYEEKLEKNKRPIRTPEVIPMAATCALGEIMQTPELVEVVAAQYPLFYSSLLLRFGTANQNLPRVIETPVAPVPNAKSPPKAKTTSTSITPSSQIVTAFKNFLECAKDEQVSKAIDETTWQRLEKDEFPFAIYQISEAVCKAHPDQMRGIFEFLFPFLRGNYPPQRVVTASVFSAFLNNCKDDKELLNKLVNSLLSSIVDPNLKLINLKGLSNIVSNGAEQTNKFAPTIIDALVSSIDDQDDVIAMESMLGLSRVFEIVDESRVAQILVNLCHRIRPAFEKNNDPIRAASFTLFGSLWRFGRDSAADAFYEQLHNNLPSLILHVKDESVDVQNACKKALRQLSPLFRNEEMTAFFAKKQFDTDRTLDYDDFLNDLSKLLISHYLDRVNYYAMTSLEYFKSSWNVIKENAANFVGLLLGNLPVEKRTRINLNPAIVARALIGLLQEKSHGVRKRAAESMSLLYTY